MTALDYLKKGGKTKDNSAELIAGIQQILGIESEEEMAQVWQMGLEKYGSDEGIAEAINEAAQNLSPEATEDEVKQAIISVFTDEQQSQIFKCGGKLHQLAQRFAKGGTVNCGCGSKISKGQEGWRAQAEKIRQDIADLDMGGESNTSPIITYNPGEYETNKYWLSGKTARDRAAAAGMYTRGQARRMAADSLRRYFPSMTNSEMRHNSRMMINQQDPDKFYERAYRNALRWAREDGLRGSAARQQARWTVAGDEPIYNEYQEVVEEPIRSSQLFSRDYEREFGDKIKALTQQALASYGTLSTPATTPVVTDPLAGKTNEELAREVIRGTYGKGVARREALGNRYGAVQSIVNSILGGAAAGSQTRSTPSPDNRAEPYTWTEPEDKRPYVVVRDAQSGEIKSAGKADTPQTGQSTRVSETPTRRKNNWFTNATLASAIAEAPAVMTAAGFHRDTPTGDVYQKQTNEDQDLATRLAIIGATGASAVVPEMIAAAAPSGGAAPLMIEGGNAAKQITAGARAVPAVRSANAVSTAVRGTNAATRAVAPQITAGSTASSAIPNVSFWNTYHPWFGRFISGKQLASRVGTGLGVLGATGATTGAIAANK